VEIAVVATFVGIAVVEERAVVVEGLVAAPGHYKMVMEFAAAD